MSAHRLTESERDVGYSEVWSARVLDPGGALLDLRIIVRPDEERANGWIAETCGSPCSSHGRSGVDASGAVLASLEWALYHGRWRFVSLTAPARTTGGAP